MDKWLLLKKEAFILFPAAERRKLRAKVRTPGCDKVKDS